MSVHEASIESSEENKPKRPWSFLVPKWHGYIIGIVYGIYGGVKIILGALDHNYEGFDQLAVFLIIGIAIFALTIGFRELQVWGWYGLVAVNGLIILMTLWGLRDLYYIFFLILSIAVLVLLFMPQTKTLFFSTGSSDQN